MHAPAKTEHDQTEATGGVRPADLLHHLLKLQNRLIALDRMVSALVDSLEAVDELGRSRFLEATKPD